MAKEPVLKTGARKGLRVRVPPPPQAETCISKKCRFLFKACGFALSPQSYDGVNSTGRPDAYQGESRPLRLRFAEARSAKAIYR